MEPPQHFQGSVLIPTSASRQRCESYYNSSFSQGNSLLIEMEITVPILLFRYSLFTPKELTFLDRLSFCLKYTNEKLQ